MSKRILSKSAVVRIRATNIDTSYYHPQRAGIIPFYRDEKDVFFCFGLDHKYKELTDFGGGIEKQDKNCLETAYRELNEESHDIFTDIDLKSLDKSIAILDDHMVIFLVETKLNPQNLTQDFDLQYRSKEISEVLGLHWIPGKEISSMLINKRELFYEKVSSLLRRAGDFFNLV